MEPGAGREAEERWCRRWSMACSTDAGNTASHVLRTRSAACLVEVSPFCMWFACCARGPREQRIVSHNCLSSPKHCTSHTLWLSSAA
jgi:hypothetical protein